MHLRETLRPNLDGVLDTVSGIYLVSVISLFGYQMDLVIKLLELNDRPLFIKIKATNVQELKYVFLTFVDETIVFNVLDYDVVLARCRRLGNCRANFRFSSSGLMPILFAAKFWAVRPIR